MKEMESTEAARVFIDNNELDWQVVDTGVKRKNHVI